jgi:hypothetical protein
MFATSVDVQLEAGALNEPLVQAVNAHDGCQGKVRLDGVLQLLCDMLSLATCQLLVSFPRPLFLFSRPTHYRLRNAATFSGGVWRLYF